MNDDLVGVFTAQGEVEETQVKSFLSAHGIPSITQGEALRKTHAFTLNGLGAAQIMVERRHEEEARRLLAEAERGEFNIDEAPDL